MYTTLNIEGHLSFRQPSLQMYIHLNWIQILPYTPFKLNVKTSALAREKYIKIKPNVDF